MVRKRPLTSKELKKNDTDVLEVRSMQNLVVKELKYDSIFLYYSKLIIVLFYRNKVDLTKYIEEHNFAFDNVFDDGADNNEVFNNL